MNIQDINGINFIIAGGINRFSKPISQNFGAINFHNSATVAVPKENVDTLLEKSIKDGSLEKVLEETIPNDEYRAKVLDILTPKNKNIETFADDNDVGTAQWDKESERIIINTSNKSNVNGVPRKTWNATPASEKLKILIHEAMHGAQASEFNTQAEEMLCEMTAIKTAAQLAKENNLPDVPLYPPTHTLQELGAMSDEDLKAVLSNEFITRGYTNRIKDRSGAVSITGAQETKLDIPAGSKILVGEREYEIGKVFIEGRGANSGTICNFFTIENGKIRGLGVATFEDIKPRAEELQDPNQQRFLNPSETDHYNNAVIVIDGKEYNMKIFDFTP